MRSLLERLLAPQQKAASISTADLQLASATLLYEAMRADGKLQADESEQLLTTLQQRWQLDEVAASDLHQQAQARADAASDLYQFTRLLCDHWDMPDRVRLIGNMWQLAYSDGHLAAEEEALIRKVADLLYVSHSDFIRTKLKVLNLQN